jgi:hypothetical protein
MGIMVATPHFICYEKGFCIMQILIKRIRAWVLRLIQVHSITKLFQKLQAKNYLHEVITIPKILAWNHHVGHRTSICLIHWAFHNLCYIWLGGQTLWCDTLSLCWVWNCCSPPVTFVDLYIVTIIMFPFNQTVIEKVKLLLTIALVVILTWTIWHL